MAHTRLASLVLAGLTFAASIPAAADPAAPAPKKDKGQCFLIRQINGFSAPDDHTVYVRVGLKRIYRLDLMKDCVDLSWRLSLGLEVQPPDSWVCDPLGVNVVYRETGIPDRCPVSAIHPLTPDEIAALPKKNLP